MGLFINYVLMEGVGKLEGETEIFGELGWAEPIFVSILMGGTYFFTTNNTDL